METNDKRHTYEADWESLDRHPLPEWYDDVKFGLFLHWGPYSSEHCGAHEFMRPELLTADAYDPYAWIALAREAGMRYITLTTKHGGGYVMFDSPHTNWGCMHSGPRRDLFGEFAAACKQEKMRFIAYYCKDDIFMPRDAPGAIAIKNQKLFDGIVKEYEMDKVINNWVDYLHGNLRTIVTKYEPDGFWFDGVNPHYQYTGMAKFVAWFYNNYPHAVIDDRVGCSTQRKLHGDYFTYERGWIEPVHILPHKWEREATLGGSFSYKAGRSLSDMESAEEIIWDLVDNVSMGGNYLLGIGPRADGSIPDYYQVRLREIGQWFSVNGEAIWETRPWIWGYFHEGDNVRYTMSKDQRYVYAFLHGWPGPRAHLEYLHSSVCVVQEARLLGWDKQLAFGRTDRSGCVVDLPSHKPSPHNVYVLRFAVKRESA